MPEEARMEDTPDGRVAKTEGWFVLHASEARWRSNERFGVASDLEGDVPFQQVGMHVHVLQPGQPACLYHRETGQEDFFVLSGECMVLIEGEERPLRAGHFVHCPPGTNHVFVGAGSGPSVVLMIGHRGPEKKLCYPVDEHARKYGASVDAETAIPREAYGKTPVFDGPATPGWPPNDPTS